MCQVFGLFGVPFVGPGALFRGLAGVNGSLRGRENRQIGELKQKALGPGGKKKLEESLKKEGIVEEGADSTKTGDNTQTDSKGGLDITPKNVEQTITLLPLPPITFYEGQIMVESTKKSSEVEINGETNKDNLINVEIKVEKKGIGFETTLTEKISDLNTFLYGV